MAETRADYPSEYQRSIDDPAGFWAEKAQDLHWFEPFQTALDDSQKPMYRWFKGGQFNMAYNCLDRHVDEGRGDKTALIYDSPVTNSQRSYSYSELTQEVATLAGALQDMGVQQGDRVIIYMPMIPEASMAMLACARIGAVHSVVFGGFSAKELSKRVADAKADFIISASCGIEVNRVIDYKTILDDAIELSDHKPKHCLIYQREQHQAPMGDIDVDWNAAMAKASAVDCVPLESSAPLYILYTSGTTGMPKGVLRDHAGQAVSLRWSMKNVYDTTEDDVFWAASDIGWVVGHSYIVYGPLLAGCTTVFYEGKPVGTPDAGAFWRMISEHKINTLFTAPTAIRVIKQQDPNAELMNDYDISSLRALFLAGERSDKDTLEWCEAELGVPVVDNWWQTETSWPIVSKPLGMAGGKDIAVKHGSATYPMPGYAISIVDDNGNVLAAGEQGNLIIKQPLPPGTLVSLWGRDEDYVNIYLSDYPGHYLSGDAGYIDEDGYVWIMGRVDDVINVAGHRLSTGQMEEVLSTHPSIVEAAVFGQKDDIKGEVPFGLVVPSSDNTLDDEHLVAELVALVRKEIGPVGAFKQVLVAKRLPKTRSGKTLRAVMRKIVNGDEYVVPPTIDDPAVIDEIKQLLEQ